MTTRDPEPSAARANSICGPISRRHQTKHPVPPSRISFQHRASASLCAPRIGTRDCRVSPPGSASSSCSSRSTWWSSCALWLGEELRRIAWTSPCNIVQFISVLSRFSRTKNHSSRSFLWSIPSRLPHPSAIKATPKPLARLRNPCRRRQRECADSGSSITFNDVAKVHPNLCTPHASVLILSSPSLVCDPGHRPSLCC